MPSSIDNRKDILLLLLYSPGLTQAVNEPITGRTRLMKMLFLFKEEALKHFRSGIAIDSGNFYQFFPWDFGPFSLQVYDDLTFFELRGFIARDDAEEETLPEAAAEWEKWINMSGSNSDEVVMSEYDEQVFRLTLKGEQFAGELFSLLSAEQKHLLQEFKARLLAAPLRALLKYVYEHFEEQTTKSKIKERVLGQRSSG